MPGLNIANIHLVPTLPYAPAYRDWSDHLVECIACFTVMDTANGGTQEIDDLCELGSPLAVIAHWAVEDQKILARRN
jgi:hypothetical protein